MKDWLAVITALNDVMRLVRDNKSWRRAMVNISEQFHVRFYFNLTNYSTLTPIISLPKSPTPYFAPIYSLENFPNQRSIHATAILDYMNNQSTEFVERCDFI